MKILFTGLLFRTPSLEIHLEIMKDLIDDKNEVYALFCDGVMNPFYAACFRGTRNNEFKKQVRCETCKFNSKVGFNLVGLPPSNIIELSKTDEIDFPAFDSVEELRAFSINGVNIGNGAASSAMSDIRDHLFDVKGNSELVSGYLMMAYTILNSLEIAVKKMNFDEVYIFNGRMADTWVIVQFCKKNNIPYTLFEVGATDDRYQICRNSSFHELHDLKKEISRHWENGEPDKRQIATEWFDRKRNGEAVGDKSYTKRQRRGSLPAGFDKNKENIVIYNSSMDEFYCFDSWRSHISHDDNFIISEIIKRFSNDETRHFYLRVHPNLRKLKNSQTTEIEKLLSEGHKNFTVVPPDSKIDSYGLLQSADKIIVTCSTIGAEGCYWGVPVILAGNAVYEDLDCVYKATDIENLFDLIRSDLLPKPKENVLPYAYWRSVFGTKSRYFNPQKQTFLGYNFRKTKGRMYLRLALKNLLNYRKWLPMLKSLFRHFRSP